MPSYQFGGLRPLLIDCGTKHSTEWDSIFMSVCVFVMVGIRISKPPATAGGGGSAWRVKSFVLLWCVCSRTLLQWAGEWAG